jgi:biotin carboxyl carrier protein
MECATQDYPSEPADRVVPIAAGQVPAAALAARVLQLQASVLSHESFAEAAAAFATEVASLLEFDRAAVGFSESGHTRVVATSHTADFDSSAELFRSFGAAMDEAVDQASTIVFPALTGGRPLISLAHADLARRYGGVVCTLPLVSHGKTFGALTLVRAGAAAPDAAAVALFEHVACIAGPILELKHEANRPWHDRARRAIASVARYVTEPGHAKVKLGVGVAIGALIGLCLIPVSYRVGAQARIEGSVQRALVAPADGFLRQVHARPGDRVKADQVLAELAEDDMKLEQRKLQSEQAQHENAASASLARTDRAQYVINQAKADEARAQLDLIDAQLVRARVVAPFDGIVIKGDLSQSLGSPVRKGEVLLTVAAGDRFRLIIEVDERDIAAVAAGQKGSVALGALSEGALPLRVVRVTPVAVARDGRNFFEVEATLEEALAALRPGLQGVAKIEAGSRPLAWIWTHRFTDWLRLTLWTWGL